MAGSAELATVREWQTRAQNVISFAELAAPVEDDDIGPFSAEGIDDPEAELQDRVDALLARSEAAVDGAVGSGLEILLGNLQVAGTLLTASQAPDDVLTDMGTDSGGPITFAEARVRVVELANAAAGEVETARRQLPESLEGKLDELQKAAGTELVELAKSPVVQTAFLGGVTSLGAALTGKAKEAFARVREALTWLKKAAVKVTEWVVDKLRSMLPESFQEKFDEIMESAKEKLTASAPEVVGESLGVVLGRASVEKAWSALTPEKSAGLEPALDTATEGQLARIGYITSGRTFVDKFDIVVSALAATEVVPSVKIAALAVVGAVVGFVGYQVWDGFHEIEALAISA